MFRTFALLFTLIIFINLIIGNSHIFKQKILESFNKKKWRKKCDSYKCPKGSDKCFKGSSCDDPGILNYKRRLAYDCKEFYCIKKLQGNNGCGCKSDICTRREINKHYKHCKV